MITHRPLDKKFDDLYTQYRPVALKIALRFMKNEADAEDVVQTVMISLLHQLQIGKNLSSPRQWFAESVKNACLNVLSTRHDTENLEEACQNEPSESPDPGLDPRLKAALRNAVDSLPAKVQEVVSRFYWGSQPVDQIAREMSISKSTVTSHLVHGRNALSKMFTLGERKVA